MACITRVVAEEPAKKKVGYQLPVSIIKAIDELAEGRVSGKEKWMIVSAAVLMLRDAAPAELEAYLTMVHEARGPFGNFESLTAKQVRKLSHKDAAKAIKHLVRETSKARN
jgi:hypothetical protein